MSQKRFSDVELQITRATSLFAVDRRTILKDQLAGAMRQGIAAGLRHDHVIALSALPRGEAEALLTDPSAVGR